MPPEIPVPDRPISCGLPGASSVIESVPSILPVVFGANVTLMVQLAPEARLPMQLSVSPKLVVELMVATSKAEVP